MTRSIVDDGDFIARRVQEIQHEEGRGAGPVVPSDAPDMAADAPVATTQPWCAICGLGPCTALTMHHKCGHGLGSANTAEIPQP